MNWRPKNKVSASVKVFWGNGVSDDGNPPFFAGFEFVEIIEFFA